MSDTNELSQEELDHIIHAVKTAEDHEAAMDKKLQEAMRTFQTAQDMKMVWIERAAKRIGVPLNRYFDDESKEIYLCWSMIDSGDIVMDEETNKPLRRIDRMEDLLALRVDPEKFQEMVAEA